jgi:sterol desaturase/sphingolipid hydroxylase (fatty acid hydroxylase superfamily)
MNDLFYGSRNARGDWTPKVRLEIAPFYRVPFDLKAFGRWLPGYFLPWNLLFALSAVGYWHWILPDIEVMRDLGWGWVLRLFAVNCVAVLLFYGAFELRLYVQRAQATRFKYDARFPGDRKNGAFLFGDQAIDGMIRSFGTGVPIWTAYEVGLLWAFANGFVPWLAFAEHPVYLGLLALLVPVIHEFHFYCIHRLLHVGPLYTWFHSVHHRAINPSPWSSLSMHPVEHLLYFSTALWHLVLPSNPVLAIYQIHFAGFGAIPGHIGFDKMEIGQDFAIDSHSYGHYLHHKYFEVNYGDGLVPLDKVFGTWHDGSPDAQAALKARRRMRTGSAEAP